MSRRGNYTSHLYIMPDISYEALAGAALVIVLAVGYQYLPKSDSAISKSKKKNKKKVKKEGESAKGVESVKKPKTAVPPPITPSDPSPSFAEVAAPEPKPKTLAQKIAPKNRKTKVDE